MEEKMAISLYHLNSDGTIPSDVINGGYFCVANNNPSPQDWTMVGITTTPNNYTNFESLNDFTDYLISISSEWVDEDGNSFDAAASAEWLWNQQV